MSEENEGKDRSIRSFVRRALGGSEAEQKESRELLSALLSTGDKAKTEVFRLVAKEVRNYVEALELHKDLHYLLTNYSLEVKASFNLKPLVPEETEQVDETTSNQDESDTE